MCVFVSVYVECIHPKVKSLVYTCGYTCGYNFMRIIIIKSEKKKKNGNGNGNGKTVKNFKDENIYKIIKTHDINKAHKHDEVSMRILKVCDLKKTFPDLWEKANVVPIKRRKRSRKKLSSSFTLTDI